PAPHAAKVARETAKAPPRGTTGKHEGPQAAHETARVAHARTAEPAVSIAKPATPARERRDAPAPRVEAVRPPQGGEAQLPKKEHGREKAEKPSTQRGKVFPGGGANGAGAWNGS